MLGLVTSSVGSRPLRALCIGAHCDDIEIGCSATLLELQRSGQVGRIDWVVLSGSDERQAETRQAMAQLLNADVRGKLAFGGFDDGAMPAQYGPIKAFFESLKSWPKPDLVFTHERDDRHQDHRIVNEMTWNTFREHLVLEYEIPKWDGGLGQPNFYVPVSPEQAMRKIAVLLKCHLSQSSRDWFTANTFEALLRLRGLECRAAGGLAEAFHARKLALKVE